MKKLMAIASIYLVVILVAGIAGAAPVPAVTISETKNSPVKQPVPSMIGPIINVEYPIDTSNASTTNRMAVTVAVRVTLRGEPVLIDKSNIKFSPVSLPSGSPTIQAINIRGGVATSPEGTLQDSVLVADLVPSSQISRRSTWVKGAYTFKIDYINDGQLLATKNFNFTISN